ncbi:hypothetical protein [Flindersiella endophytica]
MRVQVISVNHGTTPYADLLLRSLVAHHADRSQIDVLLLDSQSPDLERLDWARRLGIEVEPSGYALDVPITTHGEILRDGILAKAGCDAYLLVDSDVCFLTDNTIQAMAAELSADPKLFAVRALWQGWGDESLYEPDGYPNHNVSRIRQSVRMFGQPEFGGPGEWDTGYGDRVHPFCVLVRNDTPFRLAVELIGLSPSATECVKGAMWWDTLGLLTQVMKTHGRTWRRSSRRVLHFSSVSWTTYEAEEKNARRDELLRQYAHVTGSQTA